MKFLIKNGLVFTGDDEPEKKDILIQDDIIIKIAKDLPVDDWTEILNCEGNYVIPGLVDMCTDIGEPGFEHRENILSASKSAAKGGYTSITCQPTTEPVIDNKAVVNYVISKAKKESRVNIFPYGNMTKGGLGEEISEIGKMYKEGIVAVSDGGKTIENAGLMLNIIQYTKMFGIPVIVSCEDRNLAGNGVINKGRMSTAIGLNGIPREAEDVIVARNVLLARDNSSSLHVANISTWGSVRIIRNYKAYGMNVTCSVNPHYFTLTEDTVESYNTFAKVKPPLRTREDLEAIIDGLVDGTIDVISSGHTPTTIESKTIEFDRASYGISSLETAFPLSYTTLVKTGKMSFANLLRRMSQRPAEILGLANTKGSIKEGYDADLCIIAKEGGHIIKGSEFASRAKFTPFEGCRVEGTVLYTIVNGKIVYMR